MRNEENKMSTAIKLKEKKKIHIGKKQTNKANDKARSTPKTNKNKARVTKKLIHTPTKTTKNNPHTKKKYK